MKLLFTKPIPPNPAPSKIIPIISETLYIYLIGFQIGVELVGIPASFKAIILAAFFVGNCEQGSFSSLLHHPTAVCNFDWDATIATAAR